LFSGELFKACFDKGRLKTKYLLKQGLLWLCKAPPQGITTERCEGVIPSKIHFYLISFSTTFIFHPSTFKSGLSPSRFFISNST